VSVLYDPGGELAPVLGSGTGGLWFIPLTLALAGLLFIGGGLVIWLAFGDRILGR
jgi:hypothetical protein